MISGIMILGAVYNIVEQEDVGNNNALGVTIPFEKTIILKSELKQDEAVETLRHELIHAFLYEAGCPWWNDEDKVETLSVLIPKISVLFADMGLLDRKGERKMVWEVD